MAAKWDTSMLDSLSSGKGSKKAPEIRIIETDDWTAVYVNGKSVWQDHRLESDQLFKLLQEHGAMSKSVDIAFGNGTEFAEEQAQTEGRLPDNLAEVDWY